MQPSLHPEKRSPYVPRRVAVAPRSFAGDPNLRDELLAEFSCVTFNETGSRLSDAELVKFLRGHDAAIVGLERITAAVLEAVPELRCISKYGVGLDSLDLDALEDAGIQVGWTPGVNRRSVSELALTFMLAACRGVFTAAQQMRNGVWQARTGTLLSGKTVGIIGFGHVGRDLATLLGAFGCTLLTNDIRDIREVCRAHAVRPTSFESLLEASDVVSLHVPLTDRTRGFIDAAALARMRSGSVLINTARGELIDEAALLDTLQSGHLSACCSDVLSCEPPEDLRLLYEPRFHATPHIGGSSREAILAMGRAAIRGLGEAQPVSCLRRHLSSDGGEWGSDIRTQG